MAKYKSTVMDSPHVSVRNLKPSERDTMSDSSTQPFFQQLDSDLPIKEASITAASQWIHQCLESDPTQIPGYAEFADCKILLADLVERCISYGAGVYSDVVSRRDSLVKSGDNLGWTRYEIIVLRG